MTTPVKGIKKKVFGGVLVCLGAVIALSARIIGFELDPFYVVISLIGGCIFVYGAIQKKQEEPTQHQLTRPPGRQLIISGHKDSQ